MGLVHIYCGEGKGKTTAAMGLALRALGNGLRVCLCQFLKGAPTGEVEAFKRFEDVRVLRAEGADNRFLYQMTPKERQAYLARQRELLDRALAGQADLFVLDEALAALHAGAFSADELCAAATALKARAEVVLTGREAPREIIALADYITRMQNVRHPYERGISARRGIEY